MRASTTTHPTRSSVSGRGRPRDPKRSRAILDAARHLLREGGWDALTFEAVASRAKVGRPTVYRRWPGKGHLAAEVLAAELSDVDQTALAEQPLPDTGSLRDDLLLLTQMIMERLDNLEENGIYPGVIAEMTLDVSLAGYVRNEVLIPERDRVSEVVHRAVERGDARPDTDADFVIDALTSMIIYFRYLIHEPIDQTRLDRIADLVSHGCMT